MKNSVPFISAICFAACLLRWVCEKSDSITDEAIVLVMAFINIFSLLFVIYLLVNNIFQLVKKEIETFTIDTSRKKKYIKVVQRWSNIFIFILFTIFAYVYLGKKCYSGMWNDIISIIALGISIISDDFNEAVTEKITEVVKKRI